MAQLAYDKNDKVMMSSLQRALQQGPLTPTIIHCTPGTLRDVMQKVTAQKLDTAQKTFLSKFLPSQIPMPSLPPFPFPGAQAPPIPPMPFPPPPPFAIPVTIPLFSMFSLLAPSARAYDIASIDGVDRMYLDAMTNIMQVSYVPPLWITTAQIHAALGVDKAWVAGYSGKGVKMAFIDTGGAPHPMLPHATFATVLPMQLFDENGHGVNVTALAAGKPATTPTGVKCAGVAPNATPRCIKALGYGIGTGTTSDILKAMEAAVAWGAHVVNMSLGSPGEPEAESPMAYAINATSDRVIWCVAVGNSGPNASTVNNPAVARNAIAVGSASYTDSVAQGKPVAACFSSRGPSPDGYNKPTFVSYGGGRAISPKLPTDDEMSYGGVAWMSLLDGAQDGVKNAFEAIHGSSQATPLVAGLIALGIQAGKIKSTADVLAIANRMGVKDGNIGSGLLTWHDIMGG